MKFKRFSMLLLSMLVFALVLAVACSWLEYFSRDSHARQRQALETALNRGVLLCYALEGRYPEGLDELRRDYRLTYDESLFYVDYRPMGDNLMPDITILELSGG